MGKTTKIRPKGSNYTNAPAAAKKPPPVYRCTRCGKETGRQRGFFPASRSPLYRENNGYLPICTTCIDELYERYKACMPSEEAAMRRMCMICDLYWNPSLFEMAKKSEDSGLSLIRTYISKSSLSKYNGRTFDNTLDDEHFAETMAASMKAPVSADDEPVQQTKPKKQTPRGEVPPPSAETVTFWGSGFTPEIYQDLNLRYQKWTRHLDKPLELSTEMLYKQLCIQQVNVNLLMMAGKSVDGAQRAIGEIMTKLGISPDQQIDEDENALIENTPMGVWIRRWEDKRPLPEEDEDMKDRNGVVRYIHTWFFGHIGKMLGIKSPYTKMYEDEISRFRIERPDLADVDDDDIINEEFGEEGGDDE